MSTTATATHWSNELAKLNPCADALAWCGSRASLDEAWAECDRGDWMLWYAGRLSGPPKSASRRRLVLCACECARLSLELFERRYPDDKRPCNAIETAERWAKGDETVSFDDVRAAASAAANAAYAASAAAYAAAAAANAASAAARQKTLKTCAEIVRRHCPAPPQKKPKP